MPEQRLLLPSATYLHVHCIDLLALALQVLAFQLAWLKKLNVSQPATRPQAMLAASEQGWTTYGTTNTGTNCACIPAWVALGCVPMVPRLAMIWLASTAC